MIDLFASETSLIKKFYNNECELAGTRICHPHRDKKHNRIERKALNLGSGIKRFPDVLNIDLDRRFNPDIVADVQDLSLFKDDSVDFIYAGHIIEHVSDPEATLNEWIRITKPNGILAVVIPDWRYTGKKGTCQATQFHLHDFEPANFRKIVERLPNIEVIQYDTLANDWSFEAVLQKRVLETDICDIAIPAYNNLRYTQMCIESILKHTNFPHRLLVIDNGSTDGTAQYLKKENIPFISNESNLGVTKAWNQALLTSNAQYIAILNNDIIVSRGWLEAIMSYFEKYPELFAVSPFEYLDKKERMTVDTFNVMAAILRVTYKSDIVQGFPGSHFVLNKKLLNQIGIFDNENFPNFFSDSDYQKRIVLSKLQYIAVGASFVCHFGSKTTSIAPDTHLEDSKNRFEAKWDRLWEHLDEENRKLKEAMKDIPWKNTGSLLGMVIGH